MGTELQYCKMRVLKWMVVKLTQHCKCLMPLSYSLNMLKMVNAMLCALYHDKNK
jgi:hypothetical protein